MSDLRIGQGPFFDRGIDTITFKRGDASPGLPERRTLPPPEQAGRAQLERVLWQRTLSSYLDARTRPQVDDRQLLLPQHFRAALKGTLASLRQRAERQPDPKSREARVLKRAARLLAEEDELRELVQMYCTTLFQG